MKDSELEILVLKAQLSDRSAFGKLYQHFHVAMRKYAILRVHDPMIADDIVQNVWLKVSKRIGLLNDVSLFKSWLYKAMRWEIIDWYRKSSKEVLTFDFPDQESFETLPHDHPKALPMLKVLDINEREIAEFFYIYDLSVREIALIVGIPKGTVKSRLHRAREQLRRKLEITEKE